MGKQTMDSLWLVPLPDRSSEGVVAKDGGAEDGGAVSLRPGPCSKLFGRTVGDAQKKVPVFDAGTTASMDAFCTRVSPDLQLSSSLDLGSFSLYLGRSVGWAST